MIPDDIPDPPSGSIWTRPIELPKAVVRIGRVLLWLLVGIAAVATALSAISLVGNGLHAWAFRPGATLKLSDHVHVHVPAQFSGVEYDWEEPGVSKEYLLGPVNDQDSLRHISVSSLVRGHPLGYRDPARMATYARKLDKEVKGPVHFSHSGFEVTATIEPTSHKSRHEGVHTLNALVDVNGQLVYITGDSATIGVPDNAAPREMAAAAIDLLRLGVE